MLFRSFIPFRRAPLLRAEREMGQAGEHGRNLDNRNHVNACIGKRHILRAVLCVPYGPFPCALGQ